MHKKKEYFSNITVCFSILRVSCTFSYIRQLKITAVMLIFHINIRVPVQNRGKSGSERGSKKKSPKPFGVSGFKRFLFCFLIYLLYCDYSSFFGNCVHNNVD